jgi:glycine/sarcosine N-methyltransferase
MKTEKSVEEFYDRLAPDYDAMTGFEKRFVADRPFFRMIVERYGIKTAVDAGCGTGFHSLLLAQLGVTVTAVDLSPVMLENVSRHAKELNIRVKTVEASFQTLSRTLNKQFDAVFCLGNSLTHLLSDDELRASLTNFVSLLNPKGSLFIQILNYDRILAQRERVQNVKEVGNTTFVRFYDYEKDLLRFNILKLEKKDDAVAHSLSSIPLHPIRQSEIAKLLSNSGFNEVKFYGGISLEEFQPQTSKDLVVLARKGE